MRIIDITPITDAAEFPVKKGTLQFLQDSYTEIVSGIVQALLSPNYNPGTVYILYGVINATPPPIYTISSGFAFYNGELFFIDATSFSTVGSNTAIIQIVTTQYTTDADPVILTDSTSHNMHNIRKMQIVEGASGTGIVDVSSLSYKSFVIPAKLNPTQGGILTISGTYPDLVFSVPASSNLNPCTGAGSIHVGDVPSGGVSIPVVFGTGGQAPVQTAPYYVMFTQISQGGSPHDDTTAIVTVIDSTRTNSGFSFRLQEMVGVNQSLQIEYMIFQK